MHKFVNITITEYDAYKVHALLKISEYCTTRVQHHQYQWCPDKNLKGPHSIGDKNSSIQNVWKILRPKSPVGPAGPVMDNTDQYNITFVIWFSTLSKEFGTRYTKTLCIRYRVYRYIHDPYFLIHDTYTIILKHCSTII